MLGSRGRAHPLDKASRAVSPDRLLAEPGWEHEGLVGWGLSMVATRVTQWMAGHQSQGDPPGEHALQLWAVSLPLSPAALGRLALPFRNDETLPM